MKIEFRFNHKKATEVVLYILNKSPSVSNQKLQYLIFDADVYHLNTHGRPILGDEYYKEDKEIIPKHISYLLAQSQELNSGILRFPNLAELSTSDINALDRTLRKSEDQLLSIQHNGIVDYEDLVIDDEAIDFLKKFSRSMVI